MQVLLSFLAVSIAVAVIATPLLRGVNESHVDPEREELEAAKQAKYREIRDAQLDYRAGKLTESEWRETDRDLRREALAILSRLDRGGDRLN